jgi:hypothetical protein
MGTDSEEGTDKKEGYNSEGDATAKTRLPGSEIQP